MVSRNRNTKLQGKRILPRNFFSIHRSLDKVGVCLLNFEVKSPSIDRVKIYRNCLFKQKCRDRRTISSFPDDRLMRVLIVFVCSEATNLFSGFLRCRVPYGKFVKTLGGYGLYCRYEAVFVWWKVKANEL